MDAYMVTTTDNPYNPFDEWDEWYAFDERHGYHTTSLIARLIVTSIELSLTDQQIDYNRVVDDVVKMNSLGIYRKVIQTVEYESDV